MNVVVSNLCLLQNPSSYDKKVEKGMEGWSRAEGASVVEHILISIIIIVFNITPLLCNNS